MTEYSTIVNAENVPDSCNEFYTDFLEMNDFFGMNSDKEKIEIIDLIQHFCIWLYQFVFYDEKKIIYNLYKKIDKMYYEQKEYIYDFLKKNLRF